MLDLAGPDAAAAAARSGRDADDLSVDGWCLGGGRHRHLRHRQQHAGQPYRAGRGYGHHGVWLKATKKQPLFQLYTRTLRACLPFILTTGGRMSTVNSMVLSGPRWLNLKMSSWASGMVMAEPLYGTVRTWALLVLAWPTASGMEGAHAAQEDEGPEPPCPETRDARGGRTTDQSGERSLWKGSRGHQVAEVHGVKQGGRWTEDVGEK